jgi:hypothetical protein
MIKVLTGTASLGRKHPARRQDVNPDEELAEGKGQQRRPPTSQHHGRCNPDEDRRQRGGFPDPRIEEEPQAEDQQRHAGANRHFDDGRRQLAGQALWQP